MAVACPSCGTQNPDGNKFCQSCGKPLPAAAPVAAGAGAASAAPPPPAAQGSPAAAPPPPAGAPAPGSYAQPGYSPYYAPGQPTAVHRTPWGLIIGVVVGLLVLMGGCGVVIAAVASHPEPHPSPVAHNTATPTPAPTTAPTSAPTTGPTGAPSTAPTATPRPTPTPAPTAKPPTGGPGALSTSSFTLSAPNWKVEKQDNYSLTLLGPQQDGLLFVLSGPLQNPSSTQAQVQSIAQQVGQKFPDAKVCVKPGAEAIGGAQGDYFGLCYTFTPSNGKAFVAADYYWVGVSSSNVLYEYEVFTTADNFDNFYNKTSLPVIDSIQWKS